jgi:hypothetical protein
MLVLATFVIMGIVTYCLLKEGVFTAFTMMVNVIIAGLVAFNFYEPLAVALEPVLKGWPLAGYEDALCLVAVFALVLGLLRLVANQLIPTQMDAYLLLQQIGAVVFGLLTGYLLAGFQMCVMQTLPWQENFMDFQQRIDPSGEGQKLRSMLPPDRVWLAVMQYGSQKGFTPGDGRPPFDSDGSFELRYARYRRFNDNRDAMPYSNELAP